MAGQSSNAANINRVKRAKTTTTLIVHPEYEYWRRDWTKIRDCIAGQRVIKSKGQTYLRKLPGATSQDYKDYLDGANFFNMTGQTLAGMHGQVFRRAPLIRNFPKDREADLVRFGKDGSTHVAFAKTVVREQCSIGRYGVLVDAPRNSAKSYAVGYAAEDIVDWEVSDIAGEQKLMRVLLREYVRIDTSVLIAGVPAARVGAYPYTYKLAHRELMLVPDPETASGWSYIQRIYGEDLNGAFEEVQPLIRGLPLEEIPFVFFGASGNTADCEKPPLLDIAELNISHYRTYADLEHGRSYTALPIYYAPGGEGSGAPEYHIGPNVVWEVAENANPPGILEYKGEGLKTLERALAIKEAQIAAIGGRLLPGMGEGVSESDNQSTLREASEQSILMGVILATQDGMSQVIRYWLMWRDVPLSQTWNLRYEINTDFLTGAIDARALRAMQLMWESGILPVEVMFDYLRKTEVLNDQWTLEDFTARLKDPEAFINNPDAQAKQRGFKDRAQELGLEKTEAELDLMDREIGAIETTAEAAATNADANDKKARADAALKRKQAAQPPASGAQPPNQSSNPTPNSGAE